MHVSCNTPKLVRHRLTFVCERGAIVLDGKNTITDKFTVTVSGKAGTHRVRVRKDTGRKGEDERVRSVKKLAERFVNACVAKKANNAVIRRRTCACRELIEKYVPKDKR